MQLYKKRGIALSWTMHLVRKDGFEWFICCSLEWILGQMYQSSALMDDMNLFYKDLVYAVTLLPIFNHLVSEMEISIDK